jgi:hypothetical protein
MTPITDRLRIESDEEFGYRLALDKGDGIVSRIGINEAQAKFLIVAALTPTPAPHEETKNEDDLTRRDKQADSERQPAASSGMKGSK